MYQAVGLAQGKRVISSRVNKQANLKAHQLLFFFEMGVFPGFCIMMMHTAFY
jgi:hypothetical protein